MGVGSFGGMHTGMTTMRIVSMNSGRRIRGGGSYTPPEPDKKDDDKVPLSIKILLTSGIIFILGILIALIVILATK